jgi:hypothetical protein
MLKDMANVNVTITDSGSKIFLGTDAAVVKEGLNRLFGTRLDP